MKKLRVGVIGAGFIGEHHCRIYSQLPDVEYIGLADPDHTRATTMTRAHGGKVFKDFSELLPEVEAVSIATPTSLHHQIGLACLEKGIHALIEKPLAANPKEGKELVSLAKKKKLVLTVGHVERHNPAYLALRELLKEEEKILAIETRRFNPYTPRATDVSAIYDLMIHDLDLVLDIARSKPQYLAACGRKIHSPLPDHIVAQLNFANNLIANLSVCKASARKVREINVFTERAYFQADLLNKKLFHYQHHPTKGEEFPVAEQEPLKAELNNFIKSILNQSHLIVSGDEGLQALKLAAAVEKELVI